MIAQIDVFIVAVIMYTPRYPINLQIRIYSTNAEKFYNIYPPSARQTFLKELVENQ